VRRAKVARFLFLPGREIEHQRIHGPGGERRSRQLRGEFDIAGGKGLLEALPLAGGASRAAVPLDDSI